VLPHYAVNRNDVFPHTGTEKNGMKSVPGRLYSRKSIKIQIACSQRMPLAASFKIPIFHDIEKMQLTAMS
jgi:hypothetical protein